MRTSLNFPTEEHRCAAEAAVHFFRRPRDVAAILLVASCARGRATRDSDVDLHILVQPSASKAALSTLRNEWLQYNQDQGSLLALTKVGKYSEVDVTFVDGRFEPKPRGWTTGPDSFELEIGNNLAYSVPLWQHGNYLRQLQEEWLPYYGEDLRRQRLDMVRRYFLNNLDHIAPMVERQLCFQAFDRLYKGFQEFLQALFIACRKYPIAYNKWIREQIEEILGLPELYPMLPRLFEIQHFETDEIEIKGRTLQTLFEQYVMKKP